MVAEQKLGRQLRKGELIHHVNEVKTDNRPENIEVKASIAEHKVSHRKKKGLRMPGEENPSVKCQCGCGETFQKYDDYNRPRRFAGGHGRRGWRKSVNGRKASSLR